MALNPKPRVIKKGEARPREKSRRQILLDERATLLKRAKQIDRELQTA